MKNLKTIAIASILTGIAVAGHAQQMTQSDLQSKGATLVAKDDLATLVKGATLMWTTASGGQSQLKFGDDGSIAGNTRNAGRAGKGVDVSGTWQVTNDGKLCQAQVVRGQTNKICWAVSKLGDKYYYTGFTGSVGELDIRK